MNKLMGLMVLALGRGCLFSEEPPVSVPFTAVSHVSGTLLRDRDGAYWMVDRWPDRRPMLDRFFEGSHVRREDAIPLSAEEARCLRPTTALWYPRTLWRLVRLPTGSFWYLNQAERLARMARPAVMASWRDTPDRAELFDGTLQDLETRYRVMGPMPPPNGALFRTAEHVAIFSDEKLHLFESVALARAVGYPLDQAVATSEDTLQEMAPFGEVLTPSTFLVCPLAAAQLRQTEDHDGDGVPFFQDCDDDNPRRHPGHTEICDGIDNDCDLIVDNGFEVGHRCVVQNTCLSPSYTRCADHRLGVVCDEDEIVCRE